MDWIGLFFYLLLVGVVAKYVQPISTPFIKTLIPIGLKFIILMVVRLVIGNEIGIPFMGLSKIIFLLNGSIINGGQLAQGLAFEIGFLLIYVYLTTKHKSGPLKYAMIFLFIAVILRVVFPSMQQIVITKINGLDQMAVTSLTPNKLKINLFADMKFFDDEKFNLELKKATFEFHKKASLEMSYPEYVKFRKEFSKKIENLFLDNADARGEATVGLRRYYHNKSPKIGDKVAENENPLLALFATVIFSAVFFYFFSKKLGRGMAFTSVVILYLLILFSIFDVRKNLKGFEFTFPKLGWGSSPKKNSTPEEMGYKKVETLKMEGGSLARFYNIKGGGLFFQDDKGKMLQIESCDLQRATDMEPLIYEKKNEKNKGFKIMMGEYKKLPSQNECERISKKS